MSGYQFGHVQTYSAKGNKVNRSFQDILKENSRVPGNCNHVDEPKEPLIMFGEDPASLIPVIEKRVKDAKEALKGTGKRIQSNTHVLEGAVFSYPVKNEDLIFLDDEEKEKYSEWLDNMTKFAIADAERRGLEVLSVVLHCDERYPHIHCISVPNNERHDAKLHSDGHRASAAAKAQGKNAKECMKAYREAMAKWQDNLYKSVSERHGHMRTGPGRHRYTRPDWYAQLDAAERKAKLIREKEQLENQNQSHKSALHEVENLRSQNAQLREALSSQKAEHQAEIEKLRSENDEIRQKAKQAYDALQKESNIEIERLNQQIRELNDFGDDFTM